MGHFGEERECCSTAVNEAAIPPSADATIQLDSVTSGKREKTCSRCRQIGCGGRSVAQGDFIRASARQHIHPTCDLASYSPQWLSEQVQTEQALDKAPGPLTPCTPRGTADTVVFFPDRAAVAAPSQPASFTHRANTK
ncbi:Hypothetical protein SMAX5B_019725 [Scophthalmus maximus]|uniref:Uncharacterized protein n=1 Tax=Scophthalmus maximus TaxID=52904 RepID=A0A2U9D024_SCOMX|nr:Hypothetical protein SMAX5B_019725 [Scophthalmus maximus]